MTAGNGTAGSGASGSPAISAPTVVRSPSRTRRRASPVRRHQASSRAWACAGVTSSGSVRHHRCAAEWFAFSTTPLRQPRRDGQTSTTAP